MQKNNADIYLNRVFIITFVLLYISLFLHLGKQPLIHEEPRRAIIAMEMMYNENCITPTEFGEFYYKKPPAWNWMIIASYKLFGINEFSVRFFTVISFILTGFLVFFTGRKYVSRKFAVYCALFYYITGDLLFNFSTLGEIDIFYSLLCYSGFISIFHFYKQKKFYLLFISIYFLAAFGFLTKGFPSVPFLVISLGIFILYKRRFKLLFSLPHFVGIIIFFSILAIYFLLYNRYNSFAEYVEILWTRSSQRTVAGTDLSSLLKHLLMFPLDTLKSILPSSVFILLLIKKGTFPSIKKNEYIFFSAVIFLSNYIVYWLSPGSRQRYIYMLYPLLITVFVYFFYIHYQRNAIITKITDFIFGLFVLSIIIITSGLYLVPDHEFTQKFIIHTGSFFLIYAVIFFLYIKNKHLRVILFILCFVIARFIFDIFILPVRAENSDAQKHKEFAYQIAQRVHNDRLYIFIHDKSDHSNLYNFMEGSVGPRTTLFYLERELEKTIPITDTIIEGNYYIVHSMYINKARQVYSLTNDQIFEFYEYRRDTIAQNYYIVNIN